MGTESRGRVVRLRLEGTTAHVSEKAVNFHLWGMRYRKDGRMAFYRLDDDHVPALFQTALEHVRE